MKKFLSAVIMFCIIIFSANGSAKDVWINTSVNNDGIKTETYIMTETIRENYNELMFYVCTKAVSEYSNGVFITEFFFTYRDGNWYYTWSYQGILNPAGWELAKNNIIPPKAFNTCKPYLRLARDYPL